MHVTNPNDTSHSVKAISTNTVSEVQLSLAGCPCILNNSIMNRGWTISPTARSDTVRRQRNTTEGCRSDGVLHVTVMSKLLAKIVAIERMGFLSATKTVKRLHKSLLNCTLELCEQFVEQILLMGMSPGELKLVPVFSTSQEHFK